MSVILNLNNFMLLSSEITSALFKSNFEVLNKEFLDISIENNKLLNGEDYPTAIYYRNTLYTSPNTKKLSSSLLDKSLYPKFKEYLKNYNEYETEFNLIYKGFCSILKYALTPQDVRNAFPDGLDNLIPALKEYPRTMSYEEYFSNINLNILDKSNITKFFDVIFIYIGSMLLDEEY